MTKSTRDWTVSELLDALTYGKAFDATTREQEWASAQVYDCTSFQTRLEVREAFARWQETVNR